MYKNRFTLSVEVDTLNREKPAAPMAPESRMLELWHEACMPCHGHLETTHAECLVHDRRRTGVKHNEAGGMIAGCAVCRTPYTCSRVHVRSGAEQASRLVHLIARADTGCAPAKILTTGVLLSKSGCYLYLMI